MRNSYLQPRRTCFNDGEFIENMQCVLYREIDVEFMAESNVKNYASVGIGDINGVLPF